MMDFSSTGTLKFVDGFYKVIIDPGIVDLARALCPVKLKRQKYPPHISVTRHEKVTDTSFDSEQIQFFYTQEVFDDTRYYWLNVRSPRLVEIRAKLGLPNSSEWSRPPDKFDSDLFHITIGNVK